MSESESLTSTVFAEPSGPLCSKRKDDICSQPTASAITLPQLIATLLDPDGPYVELEMFGNAENTHQKSEANEEGLFALEGTADYSGVKKSAVIGRQTIKIDGKVYSYSSDESDAYQFLAGPYSAAHGDVIRVPSLNHLMTWFSQAENTASFISVPGSSTTTIDAYTWVSAIGLLTDKAGVHLPGIQNLEYAGYVSFSGGNWAPMAGTQFFSRTQVRCPITFELDHRFGYLTSPGAACTTEDGVALDLSIARLQVRHSRVTDDVTNSAAATANGPADGIPDRPPVAALMDANAVGGAVYGPNADYLFIQGSGPSGDFYVLAARTN